MLPKSVTQMKKTGNKATRARAGTDDDDDDGYDDDDNSMGTRERSMTSDEYETPDDEGDSGDKTRDRKVPDGFPTNAGQSALIEALGITTIQSAELDEKIQEKLKRYNLTYHSLFLGERAPRDSQSQERIQTAISALEEVLDDFLRPLSKTKNPSDETMMNVLWKKAFIRTNLWKKEEREKKKQAQEAKAPLARQKHGVRPDNTTMIAQPTSTDGNKRRRRSDSLVGNMVGLQDDRARKGAKMSALTTSTSAAEEPKDSRDLAMSPVQQLHRRFGSDQPMFSPRGSTSQRPRTRSFHAANIMVRKKGGDNQNFMTLDIISANAEVESGIDFDDLDNEKFLTVAQEYLGDIDGLVIRCQTGKESEDPSAWSVVRDGRQWRAVMAKRHREGFDDCVFVFEDKEDAEKKDV